LENNFNMNPDYELLERAVTQTVEELKSGAKSPDRARKLQLRVVENLESEITNGGFAFRVDAAVDAGGGGKHARPMDYVLGGLLSCQHMWCLRWAALTKTRFTNLAITAAAKFTWRGEYLDEADAGLTSIDVQYHLDHPDLALEAALDMSNTVARRCPVFATLRKAVTINEDILVNGVLLSRRRWLPGQAGAEVPGLEIGPG
jgi:uncharacterized OsmC-like protein